MLAAAVAAASVDRASLQRYGGRRGALGGRGWSRSSPRRSSCPLALRGARRCRRRSTRGRSATLLGCRRPPERPARVTVIAIDAGSLDLITNATAEGRLAELRPDSRCRRRHASGDAPSDVGGSRVGRGRHRQAAAEKRRAVGGGLSAGRPPASDPIQLLPDFCFATGLVRFGFLTEEPQTSASLRARTLWTILSAAGISVGVVNLPLTYRRQPSAASSSATPTCALAEHAGGSRRSGQPVSSEPRSPRPRGALRSATDAPSLPAASSGVAERHRAAGARPIAIYDRLHQALTARSSGAGVADALPEPRSDRPLLSALCHAVAVRRRHRRRAAPLRRRARGALRDRRRGDRPRDRRARPGRSAAGGVRLSGWSRSASASGCSSG